MDHYWPPGRGHEDPRKCRGPLHPRKWASAAGAGVGLYVGRHPGEPVTDDYPGQPPFAFTGGTIERVAVDVSGEPFMDLAREAQLMVMRE
ncbi:MAG TPA: hypothetical protein VMF65_20815 [Acidimicrobiales bacterium]|nr:hypothetical protein [Acidimicrobiales bacterium]